MDEGRVITLEYEDFYLVNAYVPNAQEGLKRLDYRLAYEAALSDHLVALDEKKPVLYCGDLNVAHEEIDLKNPKTNHENPGFSDEERAAMTALLSRGFIDTFRALHPEEVAYSWWSYRFQARAKNVGWRIDYFLASERLKEKITAAEIHSDIMGSDHCPVSLTVEI
jgi:exodeoxyribonuclease-3